MKSDYTSSLLPLSEVLEKMLINKVGNGFLVKALEVCALTYFIESILLSHSKYNVTDRFLITHLLVECYKPDSHSRISSFGFFHIGLDRSLVFGFAGCASGATSERHSRA